MKKFYVYVHTCTVNGKRYVGVTGKNPESRWLKGNGYRTNKHFYSAILKHGWDNFEHEVFEVDSKEEMYRKEVELISFYHSNDPRYGYNTSVGGEKSALGCTRSEEFRRKLSETQKKRYLDHPEIRRKISETQKGKPFSEDHKRHIAEAKKGKPNPRKGKPQPKVKISLPDGTILEMTKQNLARNYVNKGKKFEYLSY